MNEVDCSSQQFLSELNPEQQEAVQHFEGPILVLAGAGSGKTRILTRRVAYLVKQHKIDPRQILAVTFTNKATEEMRERLTGLLGQDAKRLWVATFHAAGLRILRQHAHLLSFSNNFVVYDAQDTKALLKTIIKDLGLPEKKYPASLFSKIIDDAKNAFILPEEYWHIAKDNRDDTPAKVYAAYQQALQQADAMDFGDLLCNTALLFDRFPEILKRYQHGLRFVLVDEYQDTNAVQYMIIAQLTAAHKNLLVVGDDDQSIYSFRGATIRNILDFEQDFPNAKVVKLEQNYRSSGNILSAAHAVIEKNEKRKSKKLWTDSEAGAPIHTYLGQDETDEAEFIASEINLLIESGASPEEIAIFYRTNAQSRALEEALVNNSIAYRIYGGLKFYERKEIKDILAYLRLIANESDNQAFLRAINTPSRGIGIQTVKSIAQHARQNGTALLAALETVPSRNNGVKAFREIITKLKQKAHSVNLAELIRSTLELTEYEKALKASKDPNSVSRIENLQELIAIASVKESDSEDNMTILREFLDRVALTSGLDTSEDSEQEENQKKSFITLMTLHLAKGLEYPYVFLTGLEEGLLPHHRSLHDPIGLEEERRLCYVGITRAMQRLYISRAFTRGMFSAGGFGMSGMFRDASRFAYDLPEDLLEHRGHEFLMGAEPETHYEEELNFDDIVDELDLDVAPTKRKKKSKQKDITGLVLSADKLAD